MLRLKDLLTIDEYREQRDNMRYNLGDVRQTRRVIIADNVALLFENKETMFFQVMEMLYLEKKDDVATRQEELNVYNPLMSDTKNIKATMQIEYPLAKIRNEKLILLKNIENRMWLQINDRPKIIAIADEDHQPSDDIKTSAVHFLRYPIDKQDRQAILKKGSVMVFGTDHPRYKHQTTIDAMTRQSIIEDISS